MGYMLKKSHFYFQKYIVVLCGVLGFFLASSSFAKTCETAVIQISALNVRTGPSTGYSTVGAANSNERYVFTGKTSGTWKEIWFDGNARWIYASSSYVSNQNAECGGVTASALNVRSGPSTGYRIVGVIPKGSHWSVTGVSGSWRRIWFASEARWVHGSYLDQSAPVPNIELSDFSINGGADTTYSRFVNLSVVASVSPAAYYRVSESADFSGSTWQAYISNISFTLSAAGGPKTVYFQARNSEGRWSNVVSSSITYIEPNASGFEIDRYSFFTSMRSYFGSLSQSQVNGINYILENMEQDTRPAVSVQSVWMRQLAYMFATVKHEVANTYLPITEYGNTYCPRYDGGCTYKGRGYVQLTHRYNYQKMSSVVGVDLVSYPERALEPEIAYTVMSHGMFYGSFTGAKLGDYILSGRTDYYNARRVVNGTDRASLISGYAQSFQTIFERSTRRL